MAAKNRHHHDRLGLLAVAAALAVQTAPARALDIAFGVDLREEGWRELIFHRHAATQYQAENGALSVRAEQSSSMLYRIIADHHPALAPARARWEWRVDEGVGATDLTRKGGDDAALALYFVFADEKTAGRLARKQKSMLRMLSARSATTLVYVFGGARPGPFTSPYISGKSRSMVLRPALSARGLWFEESVDLAGDHQRAFGAAPQRLIAIAVSSDADDTGGRNVAFLRRLSVD
ncbi:MAG: DUF3047 domain-containing protein [Parvularculaceae bacterium]